MNLFWKILVQKMPRGKVFIPCPHFWAEDNVFAMLADEDFFCLNSKITREADRLVDAIEKKPALCVDQKSFERQVIYFA